MLRLTEVDPGRGNAKSEPRSLVKMPSLTGGDWTLEKVQKVLEPI